MYGSWLGHDDEAYGPLVLSHFFFLMFHFYRKVFFFFPTNFERTTWKFEPTLLIQFRKQKDDFVTFVLSFCYTSGLLLQRVFLFACFNRKQQFLKTESCFCLSQLIQRSKFSFGSLCKVLEIYVNKIKKL